MAEFSVDLGALVHLQGLVVHIADDAGLGLQLEQLGRRDRTANLAVDDHMTGDHLAQDAVRIFWWL